MENRKNANFMCDEKIGEKLFHQMSEYMKNLMTSHIFMKDVFTHLESD